MAASIVGTFEAGLDFSESDVEFKLLPFYPVQGDWPIFCSFEFGQKWL